MKESKVEERRGRCELSHRGRVVVEESEEKEISLGGGGVQKKKKRRKENKKRSVRRLVVIGNYSSRPVVYGHRRFGRSFLLFSAYPMPSNAAYFLFGLGVSAGPSFLPKILTTLAWWLGGHEIEGRRNAQMACGGDGAMKRSKSECVLGVSAVGSRRKEPGLGSYRSCLVGQMRVSGCGWSFPSDFTVVIRYGESSYRYVEKTEANKVCWGTGGAWAFQGRGADDMFEPVKN